MQAWFTQLTNLPDQYYTAALWFVGAGVVVSVIVQLIKHFNKSEAAWVGRSLVTLFSYIAAAANYILSAPGASISVLFRNSAIVLAAAHIVYWVSVSPGYKWLTGLLTDAAGYRSLSTPQATANTETPPAPAGTFQE